MRLRRWRSLPALALVMLVFATGANAQVKNNFASSITSESMTAVWVARERGLFKKYGLDMQYIVMPRSPLAIAALVTNEIAAAIVGSGHLLSAGTSGAGLIGIANFFQKLDSRLRTLIESIGLLLDPANEESVTGMLATNLRLSNPVDGRSLSLGSEFLRARAVHERREHESFARTARHDQSQGERCRRRVGHR
ncbi:MAG: ABC transporter substrate-binding protein [Candidatus Binatia bacterium]